MNLEVRIAKELRGYFSELRILNGLRSERRLAVVRLQKS
jgi:hypothetical protein